MTVLRFATAPWMSAISRPRCWLLASYATQPTRFPTAIKTTVKVSVKATGQGSFEISFDVVQNIASQITSFFAGEHIVGALNLKEIVFRSCRADMAHCEVSRPKARPD